MGNWNTYSPSKLNNKVINGFQQLQQKVKSSYQPLNTKLERIFLQKYNQQQKKDVYELLRKWKEDPLMKILKEEAQENTSKKLYYKDIEMLSARVYDRVQQYIRNLSKKQSQDPHHKDFADYLSSQNVQFSLDRFFWSKSMHKFTNRFDTIADQKFKTQQKRQKCILANKIVAKAHSKEIKTCFQFLIHIELMSLDQNKKLGNRFILNLERISQYDQKLLYLQSMKVPSFQQPKNGAAVQRQEESAIYKKYYPNYYFYQIAVTKNPSKSIKVLHDKYQDYEFLEKRHDYIQLMFPNHYGSAFNSQSRPLNYIQSRFFSTEYSVGVKMLKSIYIFFDYLGVRFDMKALQLKIVSIQRLKDALLINTHNHLRIMRILACLSVVGFRALALKLIQFLKQFTEQGEILQKYRYKFDKNWNIYGLDSKDKGKSMCFLQEEEYPIDHRCFQQLKLIFSKLQFQKDKEQKIHHLKMEQSSEKKDLEEEKQEMSSTSE